MFFFDTLMLKKIPSGMINKFDRNLSAYVWIDKGYNSTETVADIIKIIKEVSSMEFDLEKIKEYYGELIAKKDEAVRLALANRDVVINQKLEEARAKIEAEVDAEIIAEAEAPFKHDIELCEKFVIVPEVVEEEVNVEE